MYLIDVDSQERESEAILHVVGSFFKDDLLAPLGFSALYWIVVEAQKPGLVPGIVGDVDILVGNLDFKDWGAFYAAMAEVESERPQYPRLLKEQLAGKMVAEAGGIKWPPAPSHVAGIEVKCAYFTDRLHAGKSSESKVSGIRNQIDWLQKMGLDRFALLDVVGNEPSDAESGGFLGALGRAYQSREAMGAILQSRLPQDSPAGQFVWSVGSVAGGDESMRGAGGLQLLRPGAPNPDLESKDPEVGKNRSTLLQRIPQLLAGLSPPRYFPVVFLDCRKCRRVHYLDDPLCARIPHPAGLSAKGADA